MSDLDVELESVARRVTELAREVPMDPGHRAELRRQLMTQHQALPASRGRWRRRLMSRGLTFVLSPAIAFAIALVLLMSGIGPSGHQTASRAEAARITRALARTVPTVTSLRITLRRQRAGEEIQSRLVESLVGHRLYIRDGLIYIYTSGAWEVLSARATGGDHLRWDLAFASLPSQLARTPFAVLGIRKVDGHLTEGIRYELVPRPGVQAVFTAWVDRGTGLIVRLVREELVGSTVMERDYADYQYGRTR